MNVLYIVSDDARPEMPSFGQDYVKAPNLAALSARGLTFMNAYCQQSICSPSRNSFMSVRKQLTLALTLKPNLCPYPYSTRIPVPFMSVRKQQRMCCDLQKH